ncbi:hypothetical protein ACE6H2_010702 [Prunus campanulata]
MKTKIYLNSMFPLDCPFIAIFSQETNTEREREREREREHTPSDSYNGKAWPDRREAATICEMQSCCSSSMPWSARRRCCCNSQRGGERRHQTRGGACSRKTMRLLNPRLGLGFITFVIWDLDPKVHIQSEIHLSPPNNG